MLDADVELGVNLAVPASTPDCESVNVSFRLSAKEYDQTYQRAQQARESLADFIRRRLRENDAASRPQATNKST